MMRTKLPAILLTACVLLCLFCSAGMDGFIDSLKNKLAIYQNERPFSNLYVHLDKNTYLTDESIWFKAYLLANPGLNDKVLFVRLTDKNKKIVLSDQFAMHDIRANGDILLPDTLKEGEYYFYAFTNAMISFNPNQVFVQKIRVFKNNADNMEAEACVTDSTKLHRGGNIDILIKVKKRGTYVTDTKGSYQLLVDDKPYKTGKVTTNFLGEAFISFTYPQIDDDKTLRIKATFSKDDDKAELNLNLRHEASPVIVNAYPEGGHLIEGITNRVALETGDNHNNPLPLSLLFKKDDKIIAQIKTNQYGIGQLSFIPQAGAHYTFEVPGNSNKTPIALSNNIEQTGFGLHIKKTGNQYYAHLINKGKSDSVILVLRDYDDVLWNQYMTLKNGDSTQVLLPVSDMPKGILSVALFDGAGNYAAERLFMNKQTDNSHITIETDKPVYGTRQKVKVTFDAKDLNGDPMKTNLSVAVVEKSRINTGSYTTILDSYYYKALSQSFPDQHYNMAAADDLDEILVTKKWWANNWAVVLNYQPKGFIRIIKNTEGMRGTITRLDNNPVKMKQVIIYSKAGFTAVPLDKTGSFYIGMDTLLCDRSERKYLMLNSDFYAQYKLKVENYEGEFDNMVQYANALQFLEPYNTFIKLNDKTGINLKGKIQLKEVKINSYVKTEDVQDGVFISKTCNDYVCVNNILNCHNHRTGVPAQEGGMYRYNGAMVVYHSCGWKAADAHPLLKSISLPNNFILPDYDKDPSNEPELRSTVYWSPNLNTNEYGKVSFEFFTSDIKGDFTIMAQGVNVHTLKPVYSTGSFSVQ